MKSSIFFCACSRHLSASAFMWSFWLPAAWQIWLQVGSWKLKSKSRSKKVGKLQEVPPRVALWWFLQSLSEMLRSFRALPRSTSASPCGARRRPFLPEVSTQDTVSTWGVNSVQKTYKKQKHSMAFTCSFCCSKVTQLNHFPSPALHSVLHPLLLQFLFFLGMFFNWRFQMRTKQVSFANQIWLPWNVSCMELTAVWWAISVLSLLSHLFLFFSGFFFSLSFCFTPEIKEEFPQNCAKMLLPRIHFKKNVEIVSRNSIDANTAWKVLDRNDRNINTKTITLTDFDGIVAPQGLFSFMPREGLFKPSKENHAEQDMEKMQTDFKSPRSHQAIAKLIACSMCWQDLWQSRIRNSQKVVIWPSFGLLLLQPSIFLVPNTSLSTSTGDGIRYVCWVWWSSSQLFNCLGPGLGRLAPAFGVQLHAGHPRKAAFHNTSHTTLASLASLASVDKQQQP